MEWSVPKLVPLNGSKAYGEVLCETGSFVQDFCGPGNKDDGTKCEGGSAADLACTTGGTNTK